MTWLDQYRAARSGQPPPVQYQQPVPQQQGPPAHAPFGFDQATGLPLAPYGRDGYGQIVTQPPLAPGYDPRGYPQPQGYGQAPYGYPQGQQPPGYAPRPDYDPNPLPQDPNAMIPYMQAAAHWRGTATTARAVGDCPECGGRLFDRSQMKREPGMGGVTGAGPTVTNLTTGQVATVAPECVNCGYNGLFSQSGSADMTGMSTTITGEARRAPGARSATQVAHQHGMLNLFAPKDR